MEKLAIKISPIISCLYAVLVLSCPLAGLGWWWVSKERDNIWAFSLIGLSTYAFLTCLVLITIINSFGVADAEKKSLIQRGVEAVFFSGDRVENKFARWYLSIFCTFFMLMLLVFLFLSIYAWSLRFK